MMLEIIPSGPGGSATTDVAARKRVRSQAMRHFREEQRKAREKKTDARRRLLPTRPEQTAVVDQAQPKTFDEEAAIQPEPSQSSHQHSAPLMPTSSSSSDDADSRDIGDLQLRPSLGGATFHRLALAEMFGASLIGFGTKRPRSAGLLCFRGYVATTHSDLVQATDDAMCLMLPGCTLKDDRILIDARKRHLAGIRSMQRSLQRPRDQDSISDVHVAISGALELLFLDMFKPLSLGTSNLYAGLVHLLKTHQTTLMSSKAPLTGWLLAQLRQIILLQSLLTETTLPVDTCIWDDIPHVLELIPPETDSLLQVAIKLPGLLESARAALSCPKDDVPGFQPALDGLLNLERSLMDWQSHNANNIESSGKHNGLRNIPFSSAQCQLMRLICLLLIRESIASLASALEDMTLEQQSIAYATRTSDAMCVLCEHSIRDADGAISKALSVCAPLHFAQRWYESNGQTERADSVRERVQELQEEISFLSWDSLLLWSLSSMYMNG